MRLTIQQDTLTPELFLTLYRSVGWDAPGVEQVRVALANSTATFTAYDDPEAETEVAPEPVGMVRLIGDGGMSFYIKDFAVIPSMQSQGVGAALLDALERHVDVIEPGWGREPRAHLLAGRRRILRAPRLRAASQRLGRPGDAQDDPRIAARFRTSPIRSR